MEFLEQKDGTQGILYGGIGRGRSRRDPHDYFLVQIFDKGLRDNFSRYGTVRNGIVGTDAFSPVNVKGSNARMLWNFKQVGRIGRVPSTNDKDEIQFVFLRVFYQFVYRILSFLSNVALRTVVMSVNGMRKETRSQTKLHRESFNMLRNNIPE